MLLATRCDGPEAETALNDRGSVFPECSGPLLPLAVTCDCAYCIFQNSVLMVIFSVYKRGIFVGGRKSTVMSKNFVA